MRRLSFLAFCALSACGLTVSGLGVRLEPDDGTIDPRPNDAQSDGATLEDGATIDTASGGDAGVDVEPVPDAGADGVISEPILPASDPGFIPCTFQPCIAGAGGQFCCIGKGTCEGSVTVCGKYKEVYCNEPLDCPGSKCCLGRNSAEADRASFRCANDCTAASIDGVRVCRTSADCNGPACIAVTCLGYKVGTCGGKLPPQCTDGG